MLRPRCTLWLPPVLCAAMVARSPAPANAQTATTGASALPPPVHLNSEQDHQRTMDLLHIQSLRPGPSGDPTAPNAANFDESKVDQNLKLPNPLILNNGKKVTTAKMWWKQRRPQIVELFNQDIYGRVPSHIPPVHWQVLSTTREMQGDVPVITRKLVGHVDNSSYPLITVDIQLTLTTPANVKGPVPVIMDLEFSPEFWTAWPNAIHKWEPK
jgi:hypothetical protein